MQYLRVRKGARMGGKKLEKRGGEAATSRGREPTGGHSGGGFLKKEKGECWRVDFSLTI